jgi:lycopene beta-cyclase
LNDLQPEYDYVFCGAGASACLMLLRMHRLGLLQDKSVLLIDKERKEVRDKTFCFWSHRDESIEEDLREIISHSWDTVILPGEHLSSLGPLRYNHVSSIDLYQSIDTLAIQYGWHRFVGEVSEVHSNREESHVIANGRKMKGQLIFDSRTPSYRQPENGQTHIHQSFVGWHISLPDISKASVPFRFMDFDIDQQGHTQFVYVLPFTDGTALVEVTRFSSEVFQLKEAEALLSEYIDRRIGTYTKLGDEQGCIPMCNAPIQEEQRSGIVQLGARNYSIKSSTGYAFKNMHNHAACIAENIQQGKPADAFNRHHSEVKRGRFAFYDALLLDILQSQPKSGKPIFEALFKHTNIQRILKFLDEKTTMKEEIAIFFRLPIRPFIQAAGRNIMTSLLFRPIMLTLLCLVLGFIAGADTQTLQVVNTFIIVGLVAIGIPHGAVDHLLDSGQWNARGLPLFVVKYLSIAAIMGMVWYAAPTMALTIFLIYSAWHFGQADGKLWSLNPLSSLLWGASVLLYLLGTHVEESNAILSEMGCASFPLQIPIMGLVPWMLWYLLKGNKAAALTAFWLTLSCQLPLMQAFALYFIGQHSLTGWRHIKQHLRMSDKSIWIHALPFHAGAWILLAFFYFLWPQTTSDLSNARWGIFFIFIACISLPHAMAMQSVYASGSNQSSGTEAKA